MKIAKLASVYMMGIGGIGMSALARFFLTKGIKVYGSDMSSSSITDNLQQEGVFMTVKSHLADLPEDVDLVVYSSAIDKDSDELEHFLGKNVAVKSYAEVLGLLSHEYLTIAVCGTHGKSTTTAMLGTAMKSLSFDPTVIVGTLVPEFDNRNVRVGNGEFFVVEACEYRRSFLNIQPKIVIVTNIDLDHMDYFHDEKDYLAAFREFFTQVPKDGLIVANFDSGKVRTALSDLAVPVVFFGESSEDVDYRITADKVWKKDVLLGKIKLQVAGRHNYLNALAVIALLDQMKVPTESLLRSLENFQGTWRRFEYKGMANGVEIYDDYAHHPTEIRATLQAAREKFGAKRRIFVCFQPHQYSRTKFFLEDFGKAFGDADAVIIPNIYRVRDSEEDIEKVDEASLVSLIKKNGRAVYDAGSLADAIAILKKELKNDDVFISMGAGDVWKVAEALLKNSL